MSQEGRNRYEFESRIEALDNIGNWEETMIAAAAFISVLVGALSALTLWEFSVGLGVLVGVVGAIISGGFLYYRKRIPSQVMATGLYTAGELALLVPFTTFATFYLRTRGTAGTVSTIQQGAEAAQAFVLAAGILLLALPLFGGGFLFSRRANAKLNEARERGNE